MTCPAEAFGKRYRHPERSLICRHGIMFEKTKRRLPAGIPFHRKYHCIPDRTPLHAALFPHCDRLAGPGSAWCLPAGISYILYAEAIKHVTALEATLIPVIEPILNPIWVFMLLKENRAHGRF